VHRGSTLGLVSCARDAEPSTRMPDHTRCGTTTMVDLFHHMKLEKNRMESRKFCSLDRAGRLRRLGIGISYLSLVLFVSVIKAASGQTYIGTDKLRPGDQLKKEQYIKSQTGRYVLVMQSDCNLVLYPNGSIDALWSSHTKHKGKNCYAEMQTDGNLVVYDYPRRPVWWSDTTGKARGGTLVIQDDGNAVIYRGNQAPWSTGTAQDRGTAQSSGGPLKCPDPSSALPPGYQPPPSCPGPIGGPSWPKTCPNPGELPPDCLPPGQNLQRLRQAH
jgi:hypothetical protein